MRKILIAVGIIAVLALVIIAFRGSDEENWKTATGDGFTFQYPELQTKYISAVEWPPEVNVLIAQFLCAEALQKINGRDYCIGTESGGAAGTIYITRTYNTMKNDRMVTIKFTLRYPECQNYDDPQKSECEKERQEFNPELDNLVDKIAQSVKF